MEEEEIKRMMKDAKLLGIDTNLISDEQLRDIIHIVCKEEKEDEEERNNK
jgi:hypothetical protein